MSSKSKTLNLYRNILKGAKRFPSIKRLKIVEEIRVGFRQNVDLSDTTILKKQLDLAYKGLEQLDVYNTLPKQSSNWSVDMEKNPMPKRQ